MVTSENARTDYVLPDTLRSSFQQVTESHFYQNALQNIHITYLSIMRKSERCNHGSYGTIITKNTVVGPWPADIRPNKQVTFRGKTEAFIGGSPNYGYCERVRVAKKWLSELQKEAEESGYM
jgi:hypothetical protein